MAIRPSTAYPGQTSTDPAYPYGKARNRSSADAKDGTPWEQKLVNDFFGFVQALLVASNQTPTGVPDNVAASQCLDAVKYLIRNVVGDVHLHDELRVDNDVDLLGELSVEQAARFEGLVQALAALTVSGTLTANGPLVATSGFLAPPGSSILVGVGVNVNDFGTQLGTGQQRFNVALPVKLTGAGRIVNRTATAPNSNTTFSKLSTDWVIIPTTVTAGRTYNFLEDAGGESGAEIKIINESNYTHTIQSGGTTICTIGPMVGNPLVDNSWRPSRVDLLYHNNGLVVRWLPTLRHVGV